MLAAAASGSDALGTSSSETNPAPTATREVELVTATVAFSPTASATPNPSATSTVWATATIAATRTTHEESAVPLGREVSNQGEAPNLKPSGTGSRQVLGATLTVYNCVGGTGNVYCSGGSHTSSGTEVGPGTAACDPSYKRRSFRIVGDQQAITWTCLDTGLFGGNWFDLWFYDLADGLAYIKNLPYPYQVAFVD